MFWAWAVTIPKNTSASGAVEQRLKVSKGVLIDLPIFFPAGCHGLVKVRIFKGNHQLVPKNTSDWLTGDDESVPTEKYYELKEAPYELTFKGCSPNTSYAHDVTVRVTIVPDWVASALPLINLIAKLLQRMGVK